MEDDPLYLTERWFPATCRNPAYSIPLPPGKYRVTLHFVEFVSQLIEKGGRKFMVSIENKQFLNEYQPKAQEAEKHSVTVDVNDGFLDIEFTHGSADNPTISAIEVARLK